jgi:5-(hydroxymethyl)furfural/furfural oxidase
LSFGTRAAAEFDYLIVGAGAAGCVLANRLSQTPDTRVVLIEAGDDMRPGEEPADVRIVFPLAAFNPHYMWSDTRVHWRGQTDSPAVPLPQGRGMGGSSTVMGMWALRGRPDDYDDWERAGAVGWGWESVLPYFKRLESDHDFSGPLHGTDGPVPIQREAPAAWSPLARAVDAETRRRGWNFIEDLNGDFRDGHCVMPNSRFANSRASGGICYLTAPVRRRPNLAVVTQRTATRLLIEGRQVTGVVATRRDGSEQLYRARETVLTAGALRSPVLLLRSGIGAANDLQRDGIGVVVDRPGVGKNLQNHPVLYVCALLNRRGREARGWRPAAATYLRWSSGLPNCSAGDLAIYVRSYLSWHAFGRRMASLAPALQKPASRGRVRLDPRDPSAVPLIEFNFLDDERDLSRLTDALRLATDLFESPSLREICGAPFVLTDATRLMRYNAVSRKNAWLTQLAAIGLDCNERFGLALLSRLARLQSSTALLGQPAQLANFVKEQVTGTGHVCGTCRMGRSVDRDAVCDADGRVYGIGGLRVADASVMPTVPSGNTHIPTVMVAEKLAESIRSSAASS